MILIPYIIFIISNLKLLSFVYDGNYSQYVILKNSASVNVQSEIYNNYYVSIDGNDNNSGLSPELAWKTIAKVNSQSFVPGDRIHFRRGDEWQEQLIVRQSGTDSARIVFTAYGTGAKPIINAADVTTGWADVYNAVNANIWGTVDPSEVAGRAIVVIDDSLYTQVATLAEVTSMGKYFIKTVSTPDSIFVWSITDPDTRVAEVSSREFGIVGYNHNYITISSIDVRNAGNMGIKLYGTLHDGWCIIDSVNAYRNRLAGIGIAGSDFSHNTVTNCVATYNGNGILGWEGVNNTTFSHCYTAHGVHNYIKAGEESAGSDGTGFQFYISDNVVVEYCESDSDYGGIYLDPSGSAKTMTARYNYIHDSRQIGVDGSVGIGIDHFTGGACYIYYNLLVNAGNNEVGAIHCEDHQEGSIYIYNNTICGDANKHIHSVIRFLYGANIVIKNNIFYMKTNAQADFTRLLEVGDAGAIESNYNQFYKETNQHDVRRTGTYYKNLINWRPVIKQDINSQDGDPLFTDAASDWTLQTGSPCINKGVDVGLTQDLIGNPIVGLPDIGAFESVWPLSCPTWPATIIEDNCISDALKPMGVGVYDLYSNKTVVTFLGSDGDSYVAVCDHSENNTWSDPILVGDQTNGDKYGYPQIVQTNDGIFHVFYTKQNSKLFHSCTTQPHNPYEWDSEELIISSDKYSALKPAYPTAFVSRTGTLYVFWNQTINDVVRPEFYSKSTDNGKTFQNAVPAIYPNNSNNLNEIYLGQITKEPDLPNKPEQFHFVFISAGGPQHNAYHKDIYHAVFRPENDHFYGMNGTDLGITIDETELVDHCIVEDTGTPINNLYPAENNTVVVGDNQIPVINGKFRWDGSKFVEYIPIGLPTDMINSYQWQNGKIYAFYGVTSIFIYESSDFGLNWTLTAYMLLPGRNIGEGQETIPVTYPSHPAARVWTKKVLPDFSENIVTAGGPGATGIPGQIILRSQPVYLKSGDTCTISAFICDAENGRVINANNYVRFNLTGDGSLLGSEFVAASNGRSLIFFKAGSGSGSSIITATSDGLKSSYIKIIFDEGGHPSYTTLPPDTTGNNPPPPDLELIISGVPDVFTPNGDGINETWSIPSIDNFPDAAIRIYDRNLKQIIQYAGLDPQWDGRDSNGTPLQAGAYLYVIDLNNGTRPIKGYVSLVK